MMKKITAVIVCVLCMAMLLTGCLFDDPATGNVPPSAGDDQVVNDAANAGNGAQYDAALYDNDVAQLELIASGTFYFKGSMTDENGETTPMEMACYPGGSYMASEMEGVTIGFMNIGEEYYMVFPAGECALLLDEEVCKTMDLDPTEMKMDTSSLSLGEVKDELLVDTADALLDNRIVTCRTYQQPSGNFVKTYIHEGYLARMSQVAADGTTVSTMDIEILTGSIPADKSAIPDNYKIYNGSIGMMSFMMKFASSVDMDAIMAE